MSVDPSHEGVERAFDEGERRNSGKEGVVVSSGAYAQGVLGTALEVERSPVRGTDEGVPVSEGTGSKPVRFGRI